MRTDEFAIDGVPGAYRVCDVDLTPSGRPVCVVVNASDARSGVYLLLPGVTAPVPDDALWKLVRDPWVVPPRIRSVDEDRVVIVKLRVHRDDETSGWILNRGHIEHTFHGGDDVEEVLSNDNLIVLHYGDEGMTGDVAISREGLAVFDAVGHYKWGHYSSAILPRFDAFFHAAAWVDTDEIAVYRDVDEIVPYSVCSLIRLNLRDRSQRIWNAPKTLPLPHAVTLLAERALLHEGRSGSIFEWHLDSDEVSRVGQYSNALRRPYRRSLHRRETGRVYDLVVRLR